MITMCAGPDRSMHMCAIQPAHAHMLALLCLVCRFALLSGCGFLVWDTFTDDLKWKRYPLGTSFSTIPPLDTFTGDSKWKRYPLGTSFSLICPPLADPCDTYLELFPLDRTDPFLGLAIIQGSTLPLFVIRSWPSMVQCIYRCKW